MVRHSSPVLVSQYDICELAVRSATGGKTLVVVLQHNELHPVDTVVVAPLLKDLPPERRFRLHPEITWDGEQRFVFIERMAAIERREIKSVVGSAATSSWQIGRAIDVVFFGF